MSPCKGVLTMPKVRSQRGYVEELKRINLVRAKTCDVKDSFVLSGASLLTDIIHQSFDASFFWFDFSLVTSGMEDDILSDYHVISTESNDPMIQGIYKRAQEIQFARSLMTCYNGMRDSGQAIYYNTSFFANSSDYVFYISDSSSTEYKEMANSSVVKLVENDSKLNASDNAFIDINNNTLFADFRLNVDRRFFENYMPDQASKENNDSKVNANIDELGHLFHYIIKSRVFKVADLKTYLLSIPILGANAQKEHEETLRGTGALFVMFSPAEGKTVGREELTRVADELSYAVKDISLNYLFYSGMMLKLRLLKQLIKGAVQTILIDSYAHNISAHSLAALSWWFEKRRKMLDRRFNGFLEDGEVVEKGKLTGLQPESIEKLQDNQDIFDYYAIQGLEDGTYNGNFYSLHDYMQFMPDEAFKEFLAFNRLVHYKSRKYKLRFPAPLDYALAPLFRFLRDKGAFWSGVTRDHAYGGESKTLYQILWNDFANNPLYLGTIARTEGVDKVNIDLHVMHEDKWKRGRFLTIDLSLIDYEDHLMDGNGSHTEGKGELENHNRKECKCNCFEHKADSAGNNDDDKVDLKELKCEDERFENCEEKGKSRKHWLKPEKYSKYALVRFGPCFECFRKILDTDEYRVYLPGGIVGEHAIFTILENTLRNIKHYKDKETVEDVQKNGLSFHISIEPENLEVDKGNEGKSTNRKQELFKIGTWLGHEIRNNKENQETIDELVNRVTALSKESIIDRESSPRMGGNSQDKICAAMLLNNNFSHVESQNESERDKKYYPWIHYTNGLMGAEGNYLQKYFYVWRSEVFYFLDDIKKIEKENISRFKFLGIPDSPDSDALFKAARENGVVRILKGDRSVLAKGEHESYDEHISRLYSLWFKEWFGMGNWAISYFKDDDKCALDYLDGNVSWVSYGEIDNVRDRLRTKIRFSHGGSDEDTSCNVRSHGVFWSHYFSEVAKKDPVELEKIGADYTAAGKAISMYDMFEVISTNIYIFDDRVNKRFGEFSRDKIKVFKEMGVFVRGEKKLRKRTLCSIIRVPHFLIIHLSYIEQMVDSHGSKYGEKSLMAFIRDHILDCFRNPNFIFIVTTGRGRDKWKQAIDFTSQETESLVQDQDENRRLIGAIQKQTSFKPIESILDAVETSISYNDNFDMKYKLVKLLLGS